MVGIVVLGPASRAMRARLRRPRLRFVVWAVLCGALESLVVRQNAGVPSRRIARLSGRASNVALVLIISRCFTMKLAALRFPHSASLHGGLRCSGIGDVACMEPKAECSFRSNVCCGDGSRFAGLGSF